MRTLWVQLGSVCGKNGKGDGDAVKQSQGYDRELVSLL